MSRAALVAVALLAAASCRTEISPLVRKVEPKVEAGGAPRTGCDVHDFPSATEVPTGAKNLGWVQVTREASDEETYLKLRQAVCAQGGDALSSLAWVKEVGDVAPTSLRADAWQLP